MGHLTTKNDCELAQPKSPLYHCFPLLLSPLDWRTAGTQSVTMCDLHGFDGIAVDLSSHRAICENISSEKIHSAVLVRKLTSIRQ